MFHRTYTSDNTAPVTLDTTVAATFGDSMRSVVMYINDALTASDMLIRTALETTVRALDQLAEGSRSEAPDDLPDDLPDPPTVRRTREVRDPVPLCPSPDHRHRAAAPEHPVFYARPPPVEPPSDPGAFG